MLTHRKFTLASDVWSFGVVIWEIFEYAKTPYGHLKIDEVGRQVPKGLRLSQPKDCPNIVWQVAMLCFEEVRLSTVVDFLRVHAYIFFPR